MRNDRAPFQRSRQGGVVKSAVFLMFFVSAAGVLGWMLLLPSAITYEMGSRTGFPVEAETFTCNPLGVTVLGEKMVIANNEEFGGGDPMLKIVRLNSSASLTALGRGEVRIEDFEIEISKAVIVRDERGRINLDVFMDRLFSTEEQAMPFYAERVHLIVDEVTYLDYSRPMARSNTMRVALDVELGQLEDAKAIFGPIYEIGRRVGALSGDK